MDLCLETLDKGTHRTSGESQDTGTGTHMRVDPQPFSHSRFSGAQSLPYSFKKYANFLESFLGLAVIVLTASECISSVTSNILFHFENPEFTPHYKIRKEAITVCLIILLLWLTVKFRNRISCVSMSAPIMNLL